MSTPDSAPGFSLRQLISRFSRFLTVGVANALGTLLIYQALVGFIGYVAAYTISFACGIVFAAYANTKFVFAGSLTWGRFLRFSAFYILSFGAGLLLLRALVDDFGLHPRLAPFVVAGVMAPVNYIGARILLGGTTKPPD